jgi:hypothetical protein
MLTRRLEELSTMCEMLKEFAAGHREAIDPKGLSELETLSGKIAKALTLIVGDRSFIVEGRSTRNEAYSRLQHVILEARKAIELVAVRDNKPLETPNFGSWLRNPLKVKDLAAKYIEALDAAGTDPVLDRTLGLLKSALDEYAKSHGEVTQKVFESRSFKRELTKEVAEYEGKFKSLCSYAAFNVTADNRKILLALIKDSSPRARNKTGASPKKTMSTPVQNAIPPAGQLSPATVHTVG